MNVGITESRRQGAVSERGRFQGFLTCIVVLVAFLALDDITTDNDTHFALERAAVAACGVWFAFITRQLWRQDRRRLAVVSASLLGLATVAQAGIGPGVPRAQVELLGTAIGLTWFALIWFLAIATVLMSTRPPGAIEEN